MPKLTKAQILARNKEVLPKDYEKFLALKPKTLKFFMEYLKNGGKTIEAYLISHRTSDRTKASVLGGYLLRAHPEIKAVLYDMWGFGQDEIMKTLNEAKNAQRQQIYKSEVYEFPDHYARLKALEMAQKFKEDSTQEEKDKGVKVNIMVVNDPQRHIFRVEDQVDSS